MGKKLTILLLTSTVLIGFSGWYIVGGIQAYSRYQQGSIASQEHCGGFSPVHICLQAPPAIFPAHFPYYVTTRAYFFSIDYISSSSVKLIFSVNLNTISQRKTPTPPPTARR